MSNPHYVRLPAARAPRNALLDFDPLNKAIDSIHERRENQENAMLKQKADARQEERHSMLKEEFSSKRKKEGMQRLAGIFQNHIAPEQDPTKRKAMVDALVSSHPKIGPALTQVGINLDDPDAVVQAIMAGAAGYSDPLKRRKAQADITKTEAQAKFYEQRGAHGSGQSERIISQLMESNPDLSYQEAVALSKRAPQDDTLSRERLALDAYKNDPSRELANWREFYGLTPPQTPTAAPAVPQAPAPATPTPPAPTQGMGTRENPLIPQSQADIDNAPPGTVFMVNGQIMVK